MAKLNFHIRSALFVPAKTLDRVAKALATDASIVIVDLEDAVEADSKFSARNALEKYANEHPNQRFFLRINGADSPWFIDDLALAGRIDKNVLGVMVPKANKARDVAQAERLGVPIIPLIETAEGVTNLKDISRLDGVTRLSFGELDLAHDLRIDRTNEGAKQLIQHIRSQICIHSAAAGLNPPLDAVYPNFADAEGFAKQLHLSRGMGFGGSLCIHPTQLATIHEVFMPKPGELAWAKRIIKESERLGSTIFQLDGEMIDRPVIELAKDVLKESEGVIRTR